MATNKLINLIKLVFQPQVQEGILKEVIGRSKGTIELTDEAVVELDFRNHSFIELKLGSKNITKLSVNTKTLKPGENVLIKICQPIGAKRTIVFDTATINVANGKVVTAVNGAVDYWVGVFDEKLNISPMVPRAYAVTTTTTTTTTTSTTTTTL